MLPSDIHPDLTPEDREVKRQLGKCCPRAYSDLIRSDIPSSLGVSPSCSPLSRSPSPPAIETSLGGPLAVKPTRGELQARVKLLEKKKRSVNPRLKILLRAVSRTWVRPQSWEYLFRDRLSRSGDHMPKFG